MSRSDRDRLSLFTPTSFAIAREEELSEIDNALLRPGVRGVLIMGYPGVGKSSLARTFAAAYGDRFSGGIFALNATRSDTDDLIEGKHPSLPAPNSLIIIDDLEYLSLRQIRALPSTLESYSSSRFLLTSRDDIAALPPSFERINLRGLSLKGFHNLLQAHVANDRMLADDTESVRALFRLSDGNALFAESAIDAINRGAVTSFAELLNHLKPFKGGGILAPDGSPLAPQSPAHARILLDISDANAEIISRLSKDPELVWKLAPRKFEEVVASLLESRGYEVKLTPASRDGGFDMYAVRNDALGSFLYLVECKRYAPDVKVGVKVVRQLYGVLNAEQAVAAAIVTTSSFTKDAVNFSETVEHKLKLHDYVELQKWIGAYQHRAK